MRISDWSSYVCSSDLLRLDIYSPQQVQHAPVVLFFFGGRWTEGNKEDYRFVGEGLASQGFVRVVEKYRLYPQIGRAHVCTPVTNEHLECRLRLELKKI